MEILNTTDLFRGRIAKKTKGVRAKPIVNLIVDRTVLNKFLVHTLEAREPVSADAIMCIGESNDAWQQTASALLKKYTVESIDPDGWMVCMPKPESSVEFFEAPADCYVRGLWGQTIDGVPNLQRASKGDAIVRDRSDHKDQWVVVRKIWRNTYTELTAA